MNNIEHQNQASTGEIQRSPNRIVGFFLHFMLPFVALLCGAAITAYLLKTSPEAKPRTRPQTATLVEIQTAVTGPQPTLIQAMGEIIPARQIELKPRVSGEIISLSDEFLPGGYFSAGQTMLKIDPIDYSLVLKQIESEASKAESDLLLEMGNQRIAEKELSLLDEPVSEEEKALILRKPQLEKLQATRTFSESRLAQARLDLERTEIRSPFNSVIAKRNVNTGARVTESTVLAQLVGSDIFWLRLTLPIEHLQWIDIPTNHQETGSRVKIYSQGSNGSEKHRIGHIIRLAASLEEQGRMAQLLVEVDDPLTRKVENKGKPRLLLGSYVRAEIEGTGIPTGITVDRDNIHDGGNVYLMDEEGLLDIRKIEVAFRSHNQVVVSKGINNGERIVTSPLASPIAGIPLRLVDDTSSGDKNNAVPPAHEKRRVSHAK